MVVAVSGLSSRMGLRDRETTILVWPVIVIVLWVRSIPVRGSLVLAAGVMAWALTDIMIGAFGLR